MHNINKFLYLVLPFGSLNLRFPQPPWGSEAAGRLVSPKCEFSLTRLAGVEVTS